MMPDGLTNSLKTETFRGASDFPLRMHPGHPREGGDVVTTGPMFVQPTPASVPAARTPLGPCGWLTDEEAMEECGKDGYEKIKADSRFQPAMIVVCPKHKATNNQRYAEQRAASKKH